MKKLICILAGAAGLLTACGDSEVAAPTPAPENQLQTAATLRQQGERPKKAKIDPATTTLNPAAAADNKVVEEPKAATDGQQESLMAASPTP